MPDTPIPLATSSTYTLVTGDIASNIFCRVTAHNSVGDASADSNTVGPVVAAGGDVTAPTITSSASVSNAENSVLAHTLTANETVTWSKIGGADTTKFTLTGAVLSWTSGTKDFEAPDDADANNAYIVQVRATDTASNTTDQTITVTVTNVAEGSWTPASLTGLTAWYKADAGPYHVADTTPATNGQTVVQWQDQSGLNHHIGRAANVPPVLNTTGFNTSYPAVVFTEASTQNLDNYPEIDFLAGGSTAISAFVVLQPTAPVGSYSQILSYLGTGAGSDYDNVASATLLQAHNPAGIEAVRNNVVLSNSTVTLGTNYRVGVIFDGTNCSMYINNALGSGGATASTGTFTSPGRVFVGGFNNFISAAVAEVVITKTALNSTDRGLLDTYFCTKWGLTP